MSMRLFLARPDTGPVLRDGLSEGALDRAANPGGLVRPTHLYDEDRVNDLAAQRWALIVPTGDRGRQLQDYIAPLIVFRTEQQKAKPMVFEVGPTDPPEILHKLIFDGTIPVRQRPRYLLILGDLDEVSVETQLSLSASASVGRLCFPSAEGYRGYADKVVRWESSTQPLRKARALFYSVQDPDDYALESGYNDLVKPLWEAARNPQEPTYVASSVENLGPPGLGPDKSVSTLLQAATADNPTLLFSLSHGIGALGSAEEQRRRQGALSLASAGVLDAAKLANRSFLPGGIWFLFACFGAGTPRVSLYTPWIKELVAAGMFGDIDTGALSATLACERPFVAALPQAVLANPDGPLAVVGHVDLAWGWSYREEGPNPISRSARFENALRYVGRGDRVGIGVSALQRPRRVAADLMLKLAHREAEGATLDIPQRLQRGNAWMTWHDLGSWILLGDPAARLPLGEAPTPSWRDLLGGSSAPPATPPPATPEPVAAAGAGLPDLDTMQELVLASLAGAPDAKDQAKAASVSWSTVKRWEQVFLSAGRGALDRLRSGG